MVNCIVCDSEINLKGDYNYAWIYKWDFPRDYKHIRQYGCPSCEEQGKFQEWLSKQIIELPKRNVFCG